MSHLFMVLGVLREKESGLPIPGLLVKAYDRDALFDDVLGSAVTGQDGTFEITYSEEDFAELFEQKPDLYLTIFQPPLRRLMDTRDCVRWGASTREVLEIEIPRRLLGFASPSLPVDRVEGGIRLSAKRLVVERRQGFDVPTLKGYELGGPPGAPTLPELAHYVALPPGAEVTGLKVTPGESILLPGPVNPMPAQESFYDIPIRPDNTHETDALRVPKFTPLDQKYLGDGDLYPGPLATIGPATCFLGVVFVEIRLRPVQYDHRKRTYVFHPRLRYQVTYEPPSGNYRTTPLTLDEHRAKLLTRVLSSPLVTTAAGIAPVAVDLFPMDDMTRTAQYVIITDDRSWSNDKPPFRPDPEAGGTGNTGLVAQFSRLAEWKTRRGMTTRVVTISEIVAGNPFVDFTYNVATGKARDLQEVIRNFIKFANREWHTGYVLLGGDVNIVPIRRLSGYIPEDNWDCIRGTDPSPSRRRCFIQDNGFAKLHIDPGLFADLPDKRPLETTPLFAQSSGKRIPFIGTGSGDCYWFFVSKIEFMHLTEDFRPLDIGRRSEFVVVHGPQNLIDDDYYWLPQDRLIASDLYYASVNEDCAYPGYQDFDANQNGFYGQFRRDALDKSDEPLQFPSGAPAFEANKPAVFVGRAPVRDATQAENFVEKVIFYEMQSSSKGLDLPKPYLKRRLYIADYHMHNGCYWTAMPTGPDADPGEIAADKYYTDGGDSLMRVPKEVYGLWTLEPFFDAAGKSTWRLIACFDSSTTDNQVIPLKGSVEHQRADNDLPKWYFTNKGWHDETPHPTEYVRVEGISPPQAAGFFRWDPRYVSMNIQQKEDTRKLMDVAFPEYPALYCERHYADYLDLSSPPHITPFKAESAKQALNAGPHFVSMTAHGDWSGLGGINVGDTSALTNEYEYFIAFAKACLTAKPDARDWQRNKRCPADGYHDTLGSGYYSVSAPSSGTAPAMTESGWRICSNCNGLVRDANSGRCAFGDPNQGYHHDTDGSAVYTLGIDHPAPDTQSNWRHCRKCGALVFGGAVGACAAGGGHDTVGSPNYSITHDQTTPIPGVDEWRWCRKCQGLHHCQNCAPPPQSFGETLVTQKNGAVAYVGFVMITSAFIDSYENRFWRMLALLGRLGPAITGQAGIANPTLWHTFGQMLYGDPEMPVWTRSPRAYRVAHESEVRFGDKFTVTVTDRDDKPLYGQRVTLVAGWSRSGAKMFLSRSTNGEGKTTFKIPASGDFTLADLTVSDSSILPRFKPYTKEITVMH